MDISRISVLILLGIFTFSCKPKAPIGGLQSSSDHAELLADERELQESYRNRKKIEHQVFANIETEPVEAEKTDDAADDPSIWYNKAKPSESIIFGSNKKGGIVSYNLRGEKLNYYKVGNVNNVDVTYDFKYGDRTIDLLGASNRSSQGIDIFEILKDGNLFNLSGDKFVMDTTLIDDIYGFCFGKSSNDDLYVFINGKNGLVQQYQILNTSSGLILELVREVQLDSQPEGMVVCNERQTLYIGEEQKGIWLMDINPASKSKKLLNNSGEDNGNIKYDIEGLTILNQDDTEWLIASSQGNFSYAVFNIADGHKYLGSFIIADGEKIDGAEETDGIDVITDSLSQQFPNGIFMAQDGFNYDAKDQAAQNFKYVDVRQIVNIFE